MAAVSIGRPDGAWTRKRLVVLTYLLVGGLVVAICALGLTTLGINRSNSLAAVTQKAADAAVAASEQNRKLLEERARNDQERTGLIREVRDQAATIKAQGDRLEALAKGQTAILEQVKVISQQVPDCFKPKGQCTAAAAQSAANLQAQLTQLRERQETFFQSQTFVVTDPAHPERAPLQVRPSPCQPVVSVGKVGVLPGVACAMP